MRLTPRPNRSPIVQPSMPCSGRTRPSRDFESFSIGTGQAVNLDTTVLDDTTIANGQGPNLVEDGATYIDPSGTQLQWNGDQYFARTTKTLLANGSAGQIDIAFAPTVQACGFDLTCFQGFGYTANAVFRDVTGATVGTVTVTLVGNAGERAFVGWQHTAGIAAVEIASSDYPWSPKIDDHGYGDTGLGSNYLHGERELDRVPGLDLGRPDRAAFSGADLMLTSAPVPNQPSIFFHAENQISGPVRGRVPVCFGRRSAGLPWSSLPATWRPTPTTTGPSSRTFVGTNRNFQHWFRDPAAGMSGFNTSDAISIPIVP